MNDVLNKPTNITPVEPKHNAGIVAVPVDLYGPAFVEAKCPCGWHGERRYVYRGDGGEQAIVFAVDDVRTHRREHVSDPFIESDWSIEAIRDMHAKLLEPAVSAIEPPAEPDPVIVPFIDRHGVGDLSWAGVATITVFVLVLAMLVITSIGGQR